MPESPRLRQQLMLPLRWDVDDCFLYLSCLSLPALAYIILVVNNQRLFIHAGTSVNAGH
jgi:hypothetical protein